MSGLRFGVVVLAVSLGVGCGETQPGPGAAAGSSNGAGAAGKAGAGYSGEVAATGGAAATAGAGGAGGTRTLPPDGNVPPAVALRKLDLLLMVDNSRNMIEKQQLLKDAVGWLLTPASGPKLSATDIHVGVITSSLGSHGSAGSKDVCVSAEDDDHARLIGSLRPNLTTFKNSGFLAWGPDAEPQLDTVVSQLGPIIDVAGEDGCGYEASLEAWYRFLIDPEPPASIVVPMGTARAEPQGIDQVVLTQRAAFLRPDSVLAIVMLSDENDCSLVDEGYGWLMTRSEPMYRSTSQCATNPNDKCCQSCGEQAPNPGCPAIASDASCSQGQSYTSVSTDDDLNLRCYDQKRRFGFDLLLPLARYKDGLTRQTAWNRAGTAVANPIFAGQRRHPSQVILTGIVGVPWQDLADQASLAGPGLTNLTAAELSQQGHWKAMIGDPNASPPLRPDDPFMIEGPTERTMLSSVHQNPFVPETLMPPDSNSPQANKINGHETVNMGNRQLQTACIFPLEKPKICDLAARDANKGCKCYAEDLIEMNPACQPPGGGAPTTTQYFEGAYPGIRHLQLLQSLGDNAVTASICPKVTTAGAADYGYRPAMKALAARLESAFNP